MARDVFESHQPRPTSPPTSNPIQDLLEATKQTSSGEFLLLINHRSLYSIGEEHHRDVAMEQAMPNSCDRPLRASTLR